MSALAAVEHPALTNIDTEAALLGALRHIDDLSARKIVIMSKWERDEIDSTTARRLIVKLSLEAF